MGSDHAILLYCWDFIQKITLINIQYPLFSPQKGDYTLIVILKVIRTHHVPLLNNHFFTLKNALIGLVFVLYKLIN